MIGDMFAYRLHHNTTFWTNFHVLSVVDLIEKLDEENSQLFEKDTIALKLCINHTFP